MNAMAQKFQDLETTAKGERRGRVPFVGLKTLWFNTGSLCNLACAHCYIESSPLNDRLAYLTASEVEAFLAEMDTDGLGARQIGFTGGEPFLNPDIFLMLEAALKRGHRVLVLTDAMKPMLRHKDGLKDLAQRFAGRLLLRVSIDHYDPARHESERGEKSWARMMEGLAWLIAERIPLAVAGRTRWRESEESLRAGYARLFAEIKAPVDAHDPEGLVLFPEMDGASDVPEITEGCWSILSVRPEDQMCATARMVAKRKDAPRPEVLACTLIAYDPAFSLGESLAEATKGRGAVVRLGHPHCARFCVLGKASCARS